MGTEFFRRGALGIVRLNRPQVLNALGPEQIAALRGRLAEWRDDDGVGAVLLTGAGGRAFCAGGDIRAVWHLRQTGAHHASRMLFRDEYALDCLLHRYPKPVIAWLDGIVMGGGAGISINGAFQVTTERTVFAMPEAAIGFFPDAGGTHFLCRCPGRIGLYLGLTGARLAAADLLWAGLATHHAPSDRLPALTEALARAAASTDSWAAVRATLDAAHVAPAPGRLSTWAAGIDGCFGGGSLMAVLEALAECRTEWADDARRRVAAASPTSLAVIFRQLTTGHGLTFEQMMTREYRMACAFLAGDDFAEGIRAAIIDKDWHPCWRPGTVVEISDEMVARHFAPVADEPKFESRRESHGSA